jgi:hypothetical protein
MTFRGMEGVRVHALQLYIGLSAKNPDIATEWMAASNGGEAALYNFIEKWESGYKPTLTLNDVERARELGLVTEAQAREVSQLLKDSKC